LRCTTADKIWGRTRQLLQAVEGDSGDIQVGDAGVPKEDDDVEEIPRQPYTPDENMLTQVDGTLLQFYIETIHNDWFYSVEDAEDRPYWRSGSLGHDVFQQFGPTLSSLAVRNAVILLSLQNHIG